MSLWTKNYMKIKRHFYRTEPTNFSKTLTNYGKVLIHPVMEPGREVFSLQTIESIVDHKGKGKVDLLINEKLDFFFQHIPSRKILYKDFTSPFSPHFKDLKKKLTGKKYDIFIELNRFPRDKQTMFGLLTKSKIHMCLDGSMKDPIFNMIVAADKSRSEIDRNNLVLKPLGVKKVKKTIKWKKHILKRKKKRKIGIALNNVNLGLEMFSFLEKRNYKPFIFVNEEKSVQKLQKRIEKAKLFVYPLEKVSEECSSCEFIITSINPVLSIGFLLRKRVLLLLGKEEKFNLIDFPNIEVFSMVGESKSLYKRVKVFLGEM